MQYVVTVLGVKHNSLRVLIDQNGLAYSLQIMEVLNIYLLVDVISCNFYFLNFCLPLRLVIRSLAHSFYEKYTSNETLEVDASTHISSKSQGVWWILDILVVDVVPFLVVMFHIMLGLCISC